MAHKYIWNNNEPSDLTKAGIGSIKIQDTRKMIYERLAVDHNMGGILIGAIDQDGTHKAVKLKTSVSAPSALSGGGILYTKDYTIGGVTTPDLCYRVPSGTIIKITEGGMLAILSPCYLVMNLTTAFTLTTSYTDVLFQTQAEKYPSELQLFAEQKSFIAPKTGIYLVSFKGSSSISFPIRIVKSTVAGVSSEYESAVIGAGGTGDRFFYVPLLEGEAVKIQAKKYEVYTGVYQIVSGSFKITKI